MPVFGTEYSLPARHGRMLGPNIDHRSNGRSQPLSRNWNRAIGMAGFAEGDRTLMFRPWRRIPEPVGVDANPDIENNLGRAGSVVSKRCSQRLVSLPLRHRLRRGPNSRGSAGTDWAFPIAGNLKGQVQVRTGCGGA